MIRPISRLEVVWSTAMRCACFVLVLSTETSNHGQEERERGASVGFCWLLSVSLIVTRLEIKFTGRYAGRGVALAGLLLVPFYHEVGHHQIERIVVPPAKLSRTQSWVGPLPVLQTFRGKEPFSRRGGLPLGTGDCPKSRISESL